MKLDDKKNGLIYITYGLLLFFVLYRFKDVIGLLIGFFRIIFPFVLGVFLAFLLSIPMNWIEKSIFTEHINEKLRKFKRPISLLLTLLLLVGIVYVVILMVVPTLKETIMRIIITIPPFMSKMIADFQKWNMPVDQLEEWAGMLTINWSVLGEKVLDFLKHCSTGVVSSTFGVVSSVVQATTNTVIGVIFSLYILFSKEKLLHQFKMLVYAFLPEKTGDQILKTGSLIHKTFSSFFTGQCMEAGILGFMFIITMTILKIPYALLIGVLIAVTALIPIFGAFIGCFTGVFLILMVNPMKALIFLILFLVLQQLEGNLIYPRVVGNSVGLPSIWVLVAVTTGASIMGILGMLLFIPLFSVVYALIREKTKKTLKEKAVPEKKYKKSV